MKKIRKISVQEIDILRHEAAAIKGGSQDRPTPSFNVPPQSNHHDIIAPAPYKGDWGIHASITF